MWASRAPKAVVKQNKYTIHPAFSKVYSLRIFLNSVVESRLHFKLFKFLFSVKARKMWKVWLQRKIKYYCLYLTLPLKKPWPWIWNTCAGDAQRLPEPVSFQMERFNKNSYVFLTTLWQCLMNAREWPRLCKIQACLLSFIFIWRLDCWWQSFFLKGGPAGPPSPP